MIDVDLTKTKIELHAKGVRIDKCHLEELRKRYGWNHSGFYLGDVPVLVRYGEWADSSPYEILPTAGGHALYRDGEFFADVTIPPKPRFLEKATSDGMPMHKVGEVLFTGNFSLLVNQRCNFWETGKQCCFCTAGKQAFLEIKTPQQVVEVVEAGLNEGVIKRLNVVGGYQSGPDAGIGAVVGVIEALKERFDVPVCATDISPPKDERYLEQLVEAGADTIGIYMDCFDPVIRSGMLPGKGEIGNDQYTSAWKKAVELFDENQVVSRIFAGLGETDSSVLEGSEHMASLGVIPYLTPTPSTSGSRLDGKRPPGAERMKGLYPGVADIIKDHGLNPFQTRSGQVPSGGDSALKEVLRFGMS